MGKGKPMPQGLVLPAGVIESEKEMDYQKRTLLEVKHLTKLYKPKASLFGSPGKDVIALHDLSLNILEGEIFGLVGESGSGKTTVGRLITRLEEPTQGEVYLNSSEITGIKGDELKDFRRKVQMIFQDPYQSLNPQLSVLDTVSEPLIIHKLRNREPREDLVSKAMIAVGLSPPGDFMYRYPHQLSGGQRQRVAIARAMVLKPEFVVADEPTSMLDASISAQIFNILLEMREKLGVTLLFITHSLAAARYICDRIAVIYRAHLMEMGPAEEIIRSPQHPYTQALIDALPKFGNCREVTRYGTLLKAEHKESQGTGCAFFTRCRLADPMRCGQEVPSLGEIGSSHVVACHFAGSNKGKKTPESNKCYYGT